MTDLAAISAEDLVGRIRGRADDLVALIKEAFRRRLWEELGYASWLDLCEARFADLQVRLPRELRQEQVRELRSEGMSTRAIGGALGVHHDTVAADLRSTVGNPTVDLPATVKSLDGRERPATQPARHVTVTTTESVTADLATGEVLTADEWQRRNEADDYADLDAQLVAAVDREEPDVRFESNLWREIARTKHLLELSADRAATVTRGHIDETTALLGFLDRLDAWSGAVRRGLRPNLRSIR